MGFYRNDKGATMSYKEYIDFLNSILKLREKVEEPRQPMKIVKIKL